MPTKPHALEIRFAGEDYTADKPQPDIRVENFCALIAHGKSKRAAVILSFPNASKDSASFRASRVLSDDRVRDRIAYLRAKIAQATASVSPALSQSVRDSLEDSGGSDAANAALDSISGEPKMFDDSNIVRAVEKRRSLPPPDLTPAELRRIIAEGARNGNASAINAAIKILDSQMSAPPQVADPAGLCAILFNGGGGGETLPYIAARLFDIFGKQEVLSYFANVQRDMDSEQRNIPFIMRRCDTTAQQEEHREQPDQQPKAQADEAGPAAGGGGGEGGEDARTVDV